MITRQKLREGDPVQRMVFCNQLVHTVEQNPQFLDQLVVSDEAVLSLNSKDNTRNVIKYTPYGNGHPTDHYVEFAQGADQVMVWVGLTRAGAVLGPHFAEKTSIKENIYLLYVTILYSRNFIFITSIGITCGGDKMELLRIPVMQYLRGQFPLRRMSKRGDLPCMPPSSPDLAICDFFLWGYLKHQIWDAPQGHAATAEFRRASHFNCGSMP